MATAFSHAIAALGIGACFYRREIPKSVWAAGAICAALPDLDAIGFRFGVHYGDFWGHRGFTHSLLFAVALATATMLLVFRKGVPGLGRFALGSYLFLSIASHGLLDAMTNGGLGVAFFSPFDNSRHFLPWRPIAVAPISIHRFFTAREIGIIQNEILWIWLPTAIFAVSVLILRRRFSQAASPVPN